MSRDTSPRERAFVRAYLGEAAGNATQAARLAGYSRKTASVLGNRLLRKVNIREAIQAREAQRAAQEIGTADARDRVLWAIASDEDAENSDRIRAIIELNRCSGRHSLHLIHKGKLTVAEALGLSRSSELDEPPDDAADPGNGGVN